MAASFDGNEGEMIVIKDASAMAENFRSNFPDQKKAFFYGRNKIEELLNQTGAMGIRIYFGYNGASELQLILVAANEDTDDNLNNILDTGIGCPDICGPDNALNSEQNLDQ